MKQAQAAVLEQVVVTSRYALVFNFGRAPAFDRSPLAVEDQQFAVRSEFDEFLVYKVGADAAAAADDKVRQPRDGTRTGINDRTFRAAATAAPQHQDVVAGEVRFPGGALSKLRAVLVVLGRFRA